MNTAITDLMVEGMDDMAGLLLPPQPAFVFATTGIKHDRPKKERLFRGLEAHINVRGISIPSREQSQRDTDRNYALRIGSIG